jgi:hypothetical protein
MRKLIGTIGATLAIVVSAIAASDAGALDGPRSSADSHEFQLMAAVHGISEPQYDDAWRKTTLDSTDVYAFTAADPPEFGFDVSAQGAFDIEFWEDLPEQPAVVTSAVQAGAGIGGIGVKGDGLFSIDSNGA